MLEVQSHHCIPQCTQYTVSNQKEFRIIELTRILFILVSIVKISHVKIGYKSGVESVQVIFDRECCSITACCLRTFEIKLREVQLGHKSGARGTSSYFLLT